MAHKTAMYRRHAIVCIVLCVLYAAVHGQIPDNIDGGNSGTDGNQHLTGSANTEKAIFGMNCIKDPAKSPEIQFEFFVYQKDDAFKFSSTATTVRKGQLITYEACYFINAKDYNTDKNVKAASADAGCGSDVNFKPIATPDTTSVTYDKRTKTHTLTVKDPSKDAEFQCGSQKVGTDIEVAVYCKREKNYDKDFDMVFKGKYSTADCTPTLIEAEKLEVADPPTVNVKYNLEVTMKAYVHPNIGTAVVGPESPSTNEIKTAQKLGTSAYLEACIRIPEVVAGATNINNQFFVDGISPIAVRPHTCTAAADIANEEFQADVEAMTTWPTIVLANGCGGAGATDKGLKEFLGSESYIFKWLKATVDKSWLMSPNCAKSVTFPLVSFARLKAAAEVTTIYTCKLDYCFDPKDEKCFGKDAGGTNEYPSCTATAGKKRRRRETVEVGAGLPKEATVKITVIMPGMNNTSTSSAFDGCFEKKAFIGITSALSALLVAVLVAAVFLSLKLGASTQESFTDSMTGIQNKGYY